MTQLLTIHTTHPQIRILRQAASIVEQGGVIVYPTDSCYALGCRLGDKKALTRIRRIRQLPDSHHFALICRDLSEISTYARVSNWQYKLLRMHTPGPYTFLLPATREVPKRLLHAKRKTIGIRVPQNTVALALLDLLDEPLMSVTLVLPHMALPLIEPKAIRELLAGQVDLIIDGGFCGVEPTSVLDLTGDEVHVLRKGKGDVSAFHGYEEP